MTVSKDIEKVFHKIQYLFVIKNFQTKNWKNVFNLIKGIYEKSTADIILNGERLNSFP